MIFGVLTPLYDFPWADRWFFASTLVSATNKTVRHDTCITEILLKVALSNINQTRLTVQ
jgi:hypothetical protein